MAESLDSRLSSHAAGGGLAAAVAQTIRQLGLAAIKVRDTIADGGSGAHLGDSHGEENAGGDIQKELDVLADRVFLEAAQNSPIAFYGSEEQDEAVALKADAPLAIAIDPLDGSSNIDTNVSIGTIFSLLPVEEAHRADPSKVFLQPGSRQAAAGFFVYGPQLLLVLSLGAGSGTQTYAYQPSSGGFIEWKPALSIAPEAKEFAVNASNYRHWDPTFRAYIDDCLAGSAGPRGRDFNMRWIASLVADCYRILLRGGVFLYPGDARKGYAKGRLRLLYEANPIAFCVEHAGGKATDGVNRILDIVPDGLHMRTPLVFGSTSEVESVGRYAADPAAAARKPLAHAAS